MILLAFSIPLATPMAMIIIATTKPMISHMLFPMPKIPPPSIMLTASPRVSASGAAPPKVPPMAPIS